VSPETSPVNESPDVRYLTAWFVGVVVAIFKILSQTTGRLKVTAPAAEPVIPIGASSSSTKDITVGKSTLA
jgi:hypothetical protein